LESSQTKTVPFPTDEEDDGVIRICWRGPKAKDCYNMTAMQILMEYLTDTPVAPLQRDLVEVDDPYCCDVDSMELENAVSVFGFMMEGVPMDKLSLAETKVMEVLGGFSKGNETFDMERIRNILNQRIVKILDKVENYPHYFFAFALIGDFLFGDSPEDFTAYLDQVPRYKGLLEEPSTFWKNLLEKYLTNAPKITIVGTPSSELAGTIAKDEKERVEAQREKLGANGLIQKKEELDLAIKQNDVKPERDCLVIITCQ
jgi:Zn-dependent M16 (insulinase) family peptidase